ncbi:helix-turn-helix transcriptional regulator [Paraburkholderia tropica]|uniref:helix-turn-helix transcriptional regulator n=1 Tax=Paraburkholderia tropica TaxID=92647 RepID=UPI00161F803B|nr:helix-turn-helix domain-containing protein [Paraburkholderia tropica]MBB2981806.1 excisionase family DNA binding protein [Paraburkholderia tropica]
MSTLPKLHRINAAAAALGVSRATIYRFVNQGKLTLVQLGANSSAITEDSLRAMVVGGTVATMVASDEQPTKIKNQDVDLKGKVYRC